MCGSSSSLIGVGRPSIIGRSPALTTSSKGTTTGATPPHSAGAVLEQVDGRTEIGGEDVGERADELLLVERQRQQVDRDGTLVQPDDDDPTTTFDQADRGLRRERVVRCTRRRSSGGSSTTASCSASGAALVTSSGRRRAERRRHRQPISLEIDGGHVGAVASGGVDEEGSDPAGTDDDDVIVDRRASAAHRVHGDRHRLGHGRDVAVQVAAVEVDAGAAGDGGELGERAVAMQPDREVVVAQVGAPGPAAGAHAARHAGTGRHQVALGEPR